MRRAWEFPFFILLCLVAVLVAPWIERAMEDSKETNS